MKNIHTVCEIGRRKKKTIKEKGHEMSGDEEDFEILDRNSL